MKHRKNLKPISRRGRGTNQRGWLLSLLLKFEGSYAYTYISYAYI